MGADAPEGLRFFVVVQMGMKKELVWRASRYRAWAEHPARLGKV